MSLNVANAGMAERAALANRKDDLYETPSIAVKALLHAENLPLRIWEPCAGRGAIVHALRDAGHWVYASDLVDYGESFQHGVDFLMEHRAPHQVSCIVTNPPFKLADQFVRHAIRLCPKVAMLLRLAFLESERRSNILDSGQLIRVHVFKRRLPMMHRDGWSGKRSSNGMAFAWFVWDREHLGPTTLTRI